MSTHVCLVSRQPLPNLLGVLALEPSEVFFLTTDVEDRVRRRLTERLGRAGVRSEAIRVDPYDAKSVRGACRHVLGSARSRPVLLNATGGTKVMALAAVSEFQQHEGAEAFYVNTAAHEIQWLLPADRPPTPLGVRVGIEDYLGVHGFSVSREEGTTDPETRRAITFHLARYAVRGEPLMAYFRRLYYEVDKNSLTLEAALRKCEADFPSDPGPVQQGILSRAVESGMVSLSEGSVASIRSPDDLRYLGGGRWLEEYTFLTLRNLKLDEVRQNVVVRWGDRGTERDVENEIDVVAAHRSRLYLFSCKTGGAVGSEYKDALAQDEVFKLETLRDLAGGTFGRAVLVAGSRMTDRLKARCGVLGIAYVDGNDLHRLGEKARKLVSM